MRLGMLSTTPGAKIQAAWLYLMACDHPSSSWSHSWSGGPPSTPWLTWLCGMEHCPAGKNYPQSLGTLSEQKEASFLPGQPCTWLDSCVLHKDKSAWFQPRWSTVGGVITDPPPNFTVDAWNSVEDRWWSGVLQQGWNRADLSLWRTHESSHMQGSPGRKRASFCSVNVPQLWG